MIKVFYSGNMTGYHTVGKVGMPLVPGDNTVPYHFGMELIRQGIVQQVEKETKSEQEQEAGEEEY